MPHKALNADSDAHPLLRDDGVSITKCISEHIMTISMLIVFSQRHLMVPKSLFAIDFVLSDIGSESADEKKFHLNIPDNNQATAKREDGRWQRRPQRLIHSVRGRLFRLR